MSAQPAVSVALTPALRPLDERVLACLPGPGEPGLRLAAVLANARGFERREWWEILRGLECTGHATCRAGWWRRAPSAGSAPAAHDADAHTAAMQI